LTIYLTILLSLALLIPLAGAPGAPDWSAWAIWSLGGAAGILPALLEARSRKLCPMVSLFVLFAVGRSLTALVRWDLLSLCHVLTAWTGVAAAIYAAGRPQEVRPALRWMVVPLLAVAAVQAWPGMQNTFINRNTLGMALVPVIAAWLDDRRVILPVVGLALTLSRGPMVATALMAGWYWSALRYALPGTAFAVPLLLAVRNPNSLRIHAAYWLAGVRGFLRSPLTGLGPARLGSANLEGHAHNIPLTVASWSGLMGLGLLGWGLWLSREAWSNLPRWAMAGVIGLALAGLMDDWTLHPMIMVMAGALVSGHQVSTRE